MTRGNQAVTWPADQIDQIGGAQEIGLASRRPDGSLRAVSEIAPASKDSLED